MSNTSFLQHCFKRSVLKKEWTFYSSLDTPVRVPAGTEIFVHAGGHEETVFSFSESPYARLYAIPNDQIGEATKSLPIYICRAQGGGPTLCAFLSAADAERRAREAGECGRAWYYERADLVG